MKTGNLIYICRLCGALVYKTTLRDVNLVLGEVVARHPDSICAYTTHLCPNGHTGICDFSGYKEEK